VFHADELTAVMIICLLNRLFVSAADEMFDLTLEKLDPKVVTVRDLKLSIEDAFRTKQNPPRKADAVPGNLVFSSC